MATKANPGEFDCYAAADDNEPIFVLRANDPLAPDLVRTWAEDYRNAKGESITEKQMAKYREAHECAAAMEAWKEDQVNRRHSAL